LSKINEINPHRTQISPQIVRECMSSYVGYLRGGRMIAYVIVECISNMKCKQRKQLTTTSSTSPRQHWPPLKRDANDGGWTLDRTL